MRLGTFTEETRFSRDLSFSLCQTHVVEEEERWAAHAHDLAGVEESFNVARVAHLARVVRDGDDEFDGDARDVRIETAVAAAAAS